MINKGDEIFTYSVNSKGVATVEIGKVGDKYDKENPSFAWKVCLSYFYVGLILTNKCI